MGISLEKRTETAEASLINLLKKEQEKGIDLGDLVAQVIIAIDFSGSMNSRYARGEVQAAVERSLALSLSGLDDDGDIQVFFFDDKSYEMETVNKQNYQGFVDWWASRHQMGLTNYSRTISRIVTHVSRGVDGALRADLADQPPVFVIFVTDGAPSDQPETIAALVDAARLPIFWQFVGLGYSPQFLEQLDNMSGRVIDNVGLTVFQDTLGMGDEEVYDSLIQEFFAKWLPEARSKGITKR